MNFSLQRRIQEGLESGHDSSVGRRGQQTDANLLLSACGRGGLTIYITFRVVAVRQNPSNIRSEVRDMFFGFEEGFIE